MNNSEMAAKAIKDVTGWDATIVDKWRAEVRRGQTVLQLNPIGSGVWLCSIRATDGNVSSGGLGEGTTPEAALNDVLPHYRVHIAALAADVLPSWPHLEWEGPYYQKNLCLINGKLTTRILTVYPAIFTGDTEWTCMIDHAIGPERTRDEVLARVKEYVDSLELSCSLPDFPEGGK